ncbi:hypothetical protein DFJ74DRAFT_23447 [Hyaloraphidium curvatum]|nr:hypothetical protein DFJ74DRAFT_23447 [Hyaloraphidium curvatum]
MRARKKRKKSSPVALSPLRALSCAAPSSAGAASTTAMLSAHRERYGSRRRRNPYSMLIFSSRPPVRSAFIFASFFLSFSRGIHQDRAETRVGAARRGLKTAERFRAGLLVHPLHPSAQRASAALQLDQGHRDNMLSIPTPWASNVAMKQRTAVEVRG